MSMHLACVFLPRVLAGAIQKARAMKAKALGIGEKT